jgi:hypothetical protein
MKKFFVALLCACPLALAAQTLVNDSPADTLAQLEKRLHALERLSATQAADLQKTKKQARASAVEVGEAIAKSQSQMARLEELAASVGQVRTRLTAVSDSTAVLADIQKRSADEQAQAASDLARSLSTRTYAFSALLLACLFLGAAALLYGNRKSLNNVLRLEQAFAVRDSAAARLDAALSLKLLEELSKPIAEAPTNREQPSNTDHTLSTKLADEIHRMRKRLIALPEDTPGLTPLMKSLERLQAELHSQGYEIVDHTGKPYNEQMTVKPRFIPGDDLAPGERIITKVVAPQVNYNGVMLRMADIEVSVGA